MSAYNHADYICTNEKCRFFDDVRAAALPIVGFDMYAEPWSVKCACGAEMRRVA